jgi:hypothetical protein
VTRDEEDEDENNVMAPPGFRCTLRNAQFNWVICDECRMVKDPTSSAHKLVKGLNGEGLLLLSATPIANHIQDILGNLQLIWDDDFPFDYGAGDRLRAKDYLCCQRADPSVSRNFRARRRQSVC